MTPLAVERSRIDGYELLTVEGELDIATAPRMMGALNEAIADMAAPLVVDLSDVVFMDCSVVGILITVRKRVAAAGGCLRLIGANRGPLSLIKLCRLDGVLCVHDSVDAATTPACDRRHAPAG